MAKEKAAPQDAALTEKLAAIAEDRSSLSKQASAIAIDGEDSLKQAVAFVAGIKARLKRIEEVRDGFVRPLNEHVKTINAQFKEQSEPLKDVAASVESKIRAYDLEQERKRRAEEDRLAKIRAQADAKREAQGKAPIAAPLKTVEPTNKTVATDAGVSKQKRVWKFEFVNQAEAVEVVKGELIALAIEKGLLDTVVRKKVAEGCRYIAGVKIYESIERAYTV